MRTFTGSWGIRVNFMIWLAMGCAVLYFGIAILLRTRETAVVAGSALFFLMGGGFAAMSIAGLLESFARYEVDGDGITRRGWNGVRVMRWTDVARFESSGQQDSSITLVDPLGRKLTVQVYLLGKTTGNEIRELLASHLAPVLERQERDVSLPGKPYYPTRNAAWACLVILSLMVIVAVTYFFRPVPADQRIYFNGVMAFFVVGGLFFALFTAATFTETLTFTEQGVTHHRWFRTYEIPFHRVTSVMSRMQSYKGSTWEVTTIEGDGRKVAFTSRMPDYPIVLNFIKAHVGREAADRGTATAAEVQQKEEKKARIAVPTIAAIYSALFLGLGLWFVHMGNNRLADYLRIDREGRRALGHIAGTRQGTSKSNRCLLDFQFQADGETISASSPVSYDDYRQARIGAPVPVTYLPAQPHTCTIPQSTGRKSAEGDIRLGYVNVGLACLVPPLILIPYFRKRTAVASQPPAASPGTGRKGKG